VLLLILQYCHLLLEPATCRQSARIPGRPRSCLERGVSFRLLEVFSHGVSTSIHLFPYHLLYKQFPPKVEIRHINTVVVHYLVNLRFI
jgi:hypothetical protein